MSHPLENMLQNPIEQLRELAGADTIIGAPVSAGEHTTILPVSKVSMGFVTGGGEYGAQNPIVKSGYALDCGRPYPFTGAVTAGVCSTPVAFLIVSGDDVRLLPAEQCEPVGKLLFALPELMREATGIIQSLCKKREPEEKQSE